MPGAKGIAGMAEGGVSAGGGVPAAGCGPTAAGAAGSPTATGAGATGGAATAVAGVPGGAAVAGRAVRGLAAGIAAGAVRVKAAAAVALLLASFVLAVPVTLAWSNYTQAALNEVLGSDKPGDGVLVVSKVVDSGGIELPDEFADALFSFTVVFEEADGWVEGSPSVAAATWRIVDTEGADVPADGSGEGGSGTVGEGLFVAFKLRDSQRCVFEGVPIGASWQVVEADSDGFECVSRNAEGAMGEDGAAASFTNMYDRGELDVGKSVERRSGASLSDDDYLAEYTFECEFSDGKEHGYRIEDVDAYAALACERALAAAGAQVATDGAGVSSDEGGTGSGAGAGGGGGAASGYGSGADAGIHLSNSDDGVLMQEGTVSLVSPHDALDVSDRMADGSRSTRSAADGAGDAGSTGGADAASRSGDEGAGSSGADGAGVDASKDGSRGSSFGDAGSGFEGDRYKYNADYMYHDGYEYYGYQADDADYIYQSGDEMANEPEPLRLTLKAGQRAVFEGLPDGVTVTVREVVPEDAGWTPDFKERTATVAARTSVSLGFKNTIEDDEGDPEQGGIGVGKQVVPSDGSDPTKSQAVEEFSVRLSIDSVALVKAGLVPGMDAPEDGSEPDVPPTGTRVSVPALRLEAGEGTPTPEELDRAWASWRDPQFDPETGERIEVPFEPNGLLEFEVADDGMAYCNATVSHGERIVVWGLPVGAPFAASERMTDSQSRLYVCTSGDFDGGSASRDLPVAEFVNEPTDPTVDVEVEKRWVLASDLAAEDEWYAEVPDAALPDSVLIDLLGKGGELVDSVAVSPGEDGRWTHTFVGLPELDDDGERIPYTVKEHPVDGFDSAVDGSMANGYTVTNTQHIEQDPAIVELPGISKSVTGEDAPEGVPFSFEVRAIDGAPLPDDAQAGVFAVRVMGAGRSDVGTVQLDKPGTYRYEYREIATGVAGWVYDTSVHEVTVEVTRSEGKLVAQTYIDGEPANAADGGFGFGNDGFGPGGSGSGVSGGAGSSAGGASAAVDVPFENAFDLDGDTQGSLVVTMEVVAPNGMALMDAHLSQEFLAEVELVLPEGADPESADGLGAWRVEQYTGQADDTEEATRTLRYLVQLSHDDANRPHFFGEDAGQGADSSDQATAQNARERTAVEAALDADMARGGFGTTGEAATTSPQAVYSPANEGDSGTCAFERGSGGTWRATVSAMLSHGERIAFEGLPLGTTFTVRHALDDAYPREDWSPNITLAEGTVASPSTHHVRLINAPRPDDADDPNVPDDPTAPDDPDSPNDPSIGSDNGNGATSAPTRVVKTPGLLSQTGDAVRWIILGAAAACAAAAAVLLISIRRAGRSRED